MAPFPPEEVDVPRCFQKNAGYLPVYRDKLLMIPGPTNLHPLVLKAMSKPILAHTDQQFYELMREIQDGIRYLFQTNNQYTFALTGSATLAMETSLCNVLEPGQRLLSLVHGYWGKQVQNMGNRMGFLTDCIFATDFGKAFTLDELERKLKTFRPRLLYVCHGDSSIGSVQPLEGIGRLCHRYDCMLLVDAVVSLCSTPLSMDELEIDILYSGGQKALSGPPGVSLISFSDRAVMAIKSRSHPIQSFYMDINLVANAWGIDGIRKYHYTPAINLLYGLRATIALVSKDGLRSVIQRHEKTKNHLESKIEEMGLKFLVRDPKHRLAGITSVIVPEDIDSQKVIEYLYKKYDISIGGPLMLTHVKTPKFWRIGYLGVNADPKKIDLLIDCLREAIQIQRIKAHL